MAVALVGLTWRDAVDEVLEAVGEFPAVPTVGDEETNAVYTGIALRAHDFLAREKIRVLTEGWPENTLIAITTNDFGGAPPPGSLSIKGAGADAHRTLVLDDTGTVQGILDMNNGGAAASLPVILDAVITKTWPKCSPALRDVIVSSTKLSFQRRIIGNPTADAQLMQEYLMAEMRAGRNQPRPGLQLPNLQPQVPGAGQQQQQQ
jgi:hypothetical protein